MTTNNLSSTTSIKSTEITKGTRVLLNNGWEATIADNAKKKNTRFATVYGFFTEMGSIYTHDIKYAKIGNDWVKVTHSKKQTDLQKMIDRIF